MKHRRTRAEIEQLERQILDVLTLDRPQSVRHIFYRMTNPRLPEPVEKSERGYKQVQARVLRMRRAGRLRYGWITDATRRGYHVDTFTGAGDFLDRMHGLYRADLWADSARLVEVWCESRSLAGVLLDDCERLAVSLYPCGGFSSATLPYQAADDWNRVEGKDRVVVLYVGDYDPAGVLIDRALLRELEQHSRLPIEFRRLAVNPEQIREMDLPTKPRKAGDRRRLDIQETVEAEAIPAATLRALVSDAVEACLPAGALEILQAVEEEERGGLGLIADHLKKLGVDGVLDRLDDDI